MSESTFTCPRCFRDAPEARDAVHGASDEDLPVGVERQVLALVHGGAEAGVGDAVGAEAGVERPVGQQPGGDEVAARPALAIGSGAIEGACKKIGTRLKLNSARWRIQRAERFGALLCRDYTEQSNFY